MRSSSPLSSMGRLPGTCWLPAGSRSVMGLEWRSRYWSSSLLQQVEEAQQGGTSGWGLLGPRGWREVVLCRSSPRLLQVVELRGGSSTPGSCGCPGASGSKGWEGEQGCPGQVGMELQEPGYREAGEGGRTHRLSSGDRLSLKKEQFWFSISASLEERQLA